LADIVADGRRTRAEREAGYRERALALFDHVCGRCGREFEGKRLKELTVHHRDHDHDHNPPDGSNWELLCVYCHENEHARHQVADAYDSAAAGDAEPESGLTHQPFADLARLLAKQEKSEK